MDRPSIRRTGSNIPAFSVTCCGGGGGGGAAGRSCSRGAGGGTSGAGGCAGCTATEAGAGVARLSSLVVGPAIAAGALHALPIDLGARPFFGLRHKERYRSKAAEAFLEMIGEGPSTHQPH